MMFKKITNLFLFFLFLFVQRGITQDEPQGILSSEKRKLIDENERLKILLEFKDRQIFELKNKFEREINTKNAIINDYRKALSNERKKSEKYLKDLSRYRDSLKLTNLEISHLNSVIQKYDSEINKLREEGKVQQKTINDLLDSQESLRNELEIKKREIDEIDFYTSLRVFEFKCVGYSANNMAFRFFLDGTPNPSFQGPQPVQIQLKVMKKTSMQGSREILKGMNVNGQYVSDLPIFCTTRQEVPVNFITNGQIEVISNQTGAYCNYLIEFKIVFRHYVIFEKMIFIDDLSKIQR